MSNDFSSSLLQQIGERLGEQAIHQFIKIIRLYGSECCSLKETAERIRELFNGDPYLIDSLCEYMPNSVKLFFETELEFFKENLIEEDMDISPEATSSSNYQNDILYCSESEDDLEIGLFQSSQNLPKEKLDVVESIYDNPKPCTSREALKNSWPLPPVKCDNFEVESTSQVSLPSSVPNRVEQQLLDISQMKQEPQTQEEVIDDNPQLESQCIKEEPLEQLEETGEVEEYDLTQENHPPVPYYTFIIHPHFWKPWEPPKSWPSTFASDPAVASVSKYGDFKHMKFFDKVEAVLKPKIVFNNFLRILYLQMKGHITVNETIKAVTPFLSSFPMLLKEFKDFYDFDSYDFIEEIPSSVVKRDQLSQDELLELDYYHSKKFCASYKKLPSPSKDAENSQSEIVKEVINDTWAAFPSWSGEDFQAARKTDSQKAMLHTEEERFELDFAIKSNLQTIKHLEMIQKKLDEVPLSERYRMKFDRTLGSNSVLHERNMKRIYGERINEVMDGLMKNPTVAVPIVLKRLKIRNDEWTRAYSSYEEYWKSQADKHSLKSLDLKSAHFKSNDIKSLRHKQLIAEIKILYHERKRLIAEGSIGVHFGPHIRHSYTFCIMEDALALIKRHSVTQSTVKNDKRNIDLLLYFISQYFGLGNTIENGKIYENGNDNKKSMLENNQPSEEKSKSKSTSHQKKKKKRKKKKGKFLDKKESLQTELPYSMFFATNEWYLFFRLFNVLCFRLTTLKKHSEKLEGDLTSYEKLLIRLLTGKQELNEDDGRKLFGTLGYLCVSLDRVTMNIAKILYQINVEECSRKCVSLYRKNVHHILSHQYISYRNINQQLKVISDEYQKKAQSVIGDENCFKIIWYKREASLTIELLPSIPKVHISCSEMERWTDYIDSYEDPSHLPKMYTQKLQSSAVFLFRNLRKQLKYWRKKLTVKQRIFYHSSSKYKAQRSQCLNASNDESLQNVEDILNSVPVESSEKKNGQASNATVASVFSMSAKDCLSESLHLHKNSNLSKTEECNVRENLSTDDVVIVTSVNAEINENVNYSVNNVLALPIATQVTVTTDENCGKSFTDSESKITCEVPDVINANNKNEKQVIHLPDPKNCGEIKRMNINKLNNVVKEPITQYSKPSSVDAISEKLPKSISVGEMSTGKCVPDILVNVKSVKLDETLQQKDVSKKRKKHKTSLKKPSKKKKKISSNDKANNNSLSSKHDVATGNECLDLSKNTESSKNFENYPSSIYMDNKQPVDPESAEAEVCFRKALENCIIKENTSCKIDNKTYKMRFIKNTSDVFCRKNSLKRAKKKHKIHCLKQRERFLKWHQAWIQEHTTPDMLNLYTKWLYKRDRHKYSIGCETLNSSSKPPYAPYEKYYVIYPSPKCKKK